MPTPGQLPGGAALENHKLLDAWLRALCTACGDTAKLTLLERVNVRSIRPELLDRMHDNDPALAAELLQDPAVRRRNRTEGKLVSAVRLSGKLSGDFTFLLKR
ncbi:DUF1062 domain-containing protein [Streptomyces platensis]